MLILLLKQNYKQGGCGTGKGNLHSVYNKTQIYHNLSLVSASATSAPSRSLNILPSFLSQGLCPRYFLFRILFCFFFFPTTCLTSSHHLSQHPREAFLDHPTNVTPHIFVFSITSFYFLITTHAFIYSLIVHYPSTVCKIWAYNIGLCHRRAYTLWGM